MSGHSVGPWTTEHGLIYSAEGHTVASCVDEDGEFPLPKQGPHDARLIAAAPDLAEALFNLLAAVGEIGLTQAQIEAMAKACDAASAALIASGRVMG